MTHCMSNLAVHPSLTMQEQMQEIDELPTTGPPCLSLCLCTVFPCAMLCCGCFEVNQNEDVIIQYWGAYANTVSEAGCHCSNPCGRSISHISRKQRTLDLPTQKMVDINGNPLEVSGVVQYFFEHTKRAAFQAVNADQLVKDQSSAVLKRIVSQFPYEAPDGELSLKTEAATIGEQYCEALQKKVDVAGVRVLSFSFNELSYAPEVAASMLKRQQAGAFLQAKELIVEGALGITKAAVRDLEQSQVDLTSDQKAKLVTNLLTILCSDSGATPTLPL